ncbi:SCP-2 sterol transfer family protein [Shimia isoporae]|uniref:SCP-2 sterol transfer family protein n=1 Tax=Shimia isoporae TaxID=647720 RepID=A0A4R1N1P2_9RHOB|nr:SCP2 sterol-binding domain-containing protein [Shimia isoporae]TCK99876.1 SCP-2 sterol transfer family protein [Shimia isoporae]
MLDQVVERMQKELKSKEFDGSLKFDCGADGVVVLADGTASREDRDTDCTIKITQDNLVKLLTGKLNPMTGVMTGKLKVSGEMGVAMKLGKLLA